MSISAPFTYQDGFGTTKISMEVIQREVLTCDVSKISSPYKKNNNKISPTDQPTILLIGQLEYQFGPRSQINHLSQHRLLHHLKYGLNPLPSHPQH